MPPVEVRLQPNLESRLNKVLERLHLVPNTTPPQPAVTEENEHNMIATCQVVDFEPKPRQDAQLLAWCPPIPNWNPWTGCNIDEGPEVGFATITKALQQQFPSGMRFSRGVGSDVIGAAEPDVP